MFKVDTAIDAGCDFNEDEKVSANTNSVRTHTKVPRDHCFSLSLSQLEHRHNDVEESACV